MSKRKATGKTVPSAAAVDVPPKEAPATFIAVIGAKDEAGEIKYCVMRENGDEEWISGMELGTDAAAKVGEFLDMVTIAVTSIPEAPARAPSVAQAQRSQLAAGPSTQRSASQSPDRRSQRASQPPTKTTKKLVEKINKKAPKKSIKKLPMRKTKQDASKPRRKVK